MDWSQSSVIPKDLQLNMPTPLYLSKMLFTDVQLLLYSKKKTTTTTTSQHIVRTKKNQNCCHRGHVSRVQNISKCVWGRGSPWTTLGVLDYVALPAPPDPLAGLSGAASVWGGEEGRRDGAERKGRKGKERMKAEGKERKREELDCKNSCWHPSIAPWVDLKTWI